jgi:hypothetical protein
MPILPFDGEGFVDKLSKSHFKISQDDEKETPRTSGCRRSRRCDQNDGQPFLRNPEQVSVALRGKIAAALDELGYIPNRAPDILSNATSRAVGVLLPSDQPGFRRSLRAALKASPMRLAIRPCSPTTGTSRNWKKNVLNRCFPGTSTA